MPEAAQKTRGDETRNLLLEAGLQLFGTRGFDSVTTRQLTEQAGANLASIAYHFGGKRELYRAVLRQLVSDVAAREMPAVVALRDGLPAAARRPEDLARLVARFVHGMTVFFLDDAFMRNRVPLILREFSQPSEDFEIFYAGWLEPMHRAMTGVAAAALDRHPDDPDCAIRAHTIIGQIVVFGIGRVVLFRRLGWDGYTVERTARIDRVIGASVLGSLGLPAVDAMDDDDRQEMSNGH